MPNIDEDFVRRVPTSSPGLQHLTLGNAALSSMAALDAASDAGLPLHLLVLKACEIPEPELNTFLEKLSDPHHVVGKRLQQLRLGKDWRVNLSEQTVHQLRTVLEQNTRLSYLCFYGPYKRDGDKALVNKFHGSKISAVQALPASAKYLAFLGSVRQIAQQSPAFAILSSEHVASHVLEYAGEPVRRAVVWCQNEPRSMFLAGQGPW